MVHGFVPHRARHEATDEAVTNVLSEVESTQPSIPEIRVLLIDDDEDDYVIIRDLIEEARHTRYALSWESTYVAGYAALVGGGYDACLVDYRLDRHNGIDLLRSAIEQGCTIPIVMLTGRGDDEIDTAAMNAGAADFLVKGKIDPDDLERALRHAIDRAAGWRSVRMAEAKQRAMMAGIPDTVFRVSPEGTILDYRAGIESDPAIGIVGDEATLSSAFGPSVASTLMDAVREAMASGVACSCEMTREGMINVRHFEARVIPVEDANEVVVIARDFTDEKVASQRLEDLAQAKDRFLGRISHDLRTPLTTVLGYTDLLRTEWSQFTSEEHFEMIDAVGRGAAKIGHLFDDTLVMARYETDRLVLAPARVNLAWHGARAAKMFAGDADVEIIDEGSAAFAVADPIRLDQILRHLVSNAASHGGQHIEIVTGQTQGRSWIEVRDDGAGIPESERPWAQEPLDRSDQSLDTSVSVGVGLTVSHRLAHLMQGDLTYRYESGWSKFRLEFEAADQLAECATLENVDARQPSAGPGRDGSESRSDSVLPWLQ